MIRLAALLLLALPVQAKPRKPVPGADELILRSLAAQSTGYSLRERIQVFGAARKPKAIRAVVTVAPDGRERREIFPARKTGKSVILIRGPWDREAPEKGLARLKSFFELSASSAGVVAKRKTWRVDARDRDGVLRRSLWFDRESGLRLKREDYGTDGELRRRVRAIRVEMPAAAEASAFRPEPARGPWAPDGFVLIGRAGEVQRYSNGLESFAILVENGKRVVQGDLAEDDAARVLESAGR